VVRGDGRGRQLGFPTANIEPAAAEKQIPAEGIYAVRVRVDSDVPEYEGVLHLGERPTFPGATPTVEVMLLDFDADLYGRSLSVEFCARVRGVQRFESSDALVQAMHADVAATRALLAGGRSRPIA
jgi:riboflavin kinase/FMN adenylyltransferase